LVSKVLVVVDDLEVLELEVVDLVGLQRPLEVEAGRVLVRVLHPAALEQRLLEVAVAARDDEHLLPGLQPLLLLPGLEVHGVRVLAQHGRLLGLGLPVRRLRPRPHPDLPVHLLENRQHLLAVLLLDLVLLLPLISHLGFLLVLILPQLQLLLDLVDVPFHN